jgi:hypothetical protein
MWKPNGSNPMTDTWWIATCTHCLRVLGAFQTEGFADTRALAALKVCPEPSCGAQFARQVTGAAPGGRWNYRVDVRPRPRATTEGKDSAAIVDLALLPAVRLTGSPSGIELLEDLKELNEVSRRALPNATLALWEKILHGAIWARGQREGWWKGEWDELSLANLLNPRGPQGPRGEIASRTSSSLIERLAELSMGRSDRPKGAYYPSTTLEHAWSAVDALSEFLTVWF